MATYLKHKDGQPARKRESKKQTQTKADLSTEYRDSRCVAEAIDVFASIFSTWVTQERNGDNASPAYSSPTGYPVKVALSSLDGEEVESIADSLKRIADAMTSK
jgi:transposase-like protein